MLGMQIRQLLLRAILATCPLVVDAHAGELPR